MNFLKEILGDELFSKVKEKLGDKKVDIVSDGNWIPKAKFDSLNEDLKEMKSQIGERDKQLKELGEKAGDNSELVKQIEELKAVNEKTISDYEAKIKEKEFNYALETALTNTKAKNVKALKALLDLESVKLDEKGQVIGLDEQIKNLKSTDAYLFNEESGGIKGRVPNGSGKSGLGGLNPFSKEHFNLTEQGKLLRENPELAQKYREQAQ